MSRSGSYQTIWLSCGGSWRQLELPSAEEEVVPGVAWGDAYELFTPAFWRCQIEQRRLIDGTPSYRLGTTLAEELAACLLGGYGLPAELGLMAYERLRREGLLSGTASAYDIEARLGAPFETARGLRRYRFPRQKARYLAPALKAVYGMDQPSCDLALRTSLLELSGVGPKTASWIVRNHRSSDSVAILDVHIVRAGVKMRLFPETADPLKTYFELEERFLGFCGGLGAAASHLDALMWNTMRRIGSALNRSRTSRQRPLPL